MTVFRTYLLALALLALLVVGAHAAQARPVKAGPPESVEVRGSPAGRLPGPVAGPVAAAAQSRGPQRPRVSAAAGRPRRNIRTAGAAGTVPFRAGCYPVRPRCKPKKFYEQELARIFTPGQYNAYCWLTRQSAVSGR